MSRRLITGEGKNIWKPEPRKVYYLYERGFSGVSAFREPPPPSPVIFRMFDGVSGIKAAGKEAFPHRGARGVRKKPNGLAFSAERRCGCAAADGFSTEGRKDG